MMRRDRLTNLVTDSRGEKRAIQSCENGAADCVVKHNLSKLVPVAQRPLRKAGKGTTLVRKKQANSGIRRVNSELQSLVIERTAQLKAANRELEAFSYSVSHDLRAPLRHILGYVDILQTGSSQTLDETSRQHLLTIARSAALLGQMMDALLEFSRRGRVEMQSKRVRAAALVEDARRELGSEMKGREINWQIGDLPEVQGDPAMLRQAIVNLLSNAIKFTRTRLRARIRIGATKGSRETIFFVRDNGIGFNMKCADKLFGLFQRFHPPGDFEGIGIGLANVRRIIQRHGGRTWAEGQADSGATFYFSIPSPPVKVTGSKRNGYCGPL